MMKITIQNIFVALGLATVCIVVLIVLVGFVGIGSDLVDQKDPAVDVIFWRAINVVRGLGICVIPFVFIIAFALLQRFRIK